MISHTAKESTISTDWISQGSVVVGIIFTCAVFLFLFTLMMMGGYFILKNSVDKKGGPLVSS
jgi:hypothetical protein